MSKRQNSHSVRAAALCCSQRARNVIRPLSPLGRIARIADTNCPSRRRELHKIPLWRRDAVRLRDLAKVLSKLTQVATVVTNGAFGESKFTAKILSKSRDR